MSVARTLRGARPGAPRLISRPSVAIMAAAAFAGCASRASVLPFIDREAPPGVVTNHVVVVSIDGLRPDAIEKFGATTLQRLMREGSYTLSAKTIMPSKTLPSHTSMLTGEEPKEHGITWNTNQTGAHGHVDVPTVFAVAHQRGFQTAAFFSKSKFEHLEAAGTLDYSQSPGGWFGKWSMSRTLGDVERYLTRNRPSVLFVHIGEPDFAGHAHGWMSAQYGRNVRTADAGVARLITAADSAFGAGNYTMIVTADHGGHGRNHGSADPRDVTIPWITWGRGVQAGTTIADSVRTMDTASTVLWLLGLKEPGDWTGAPVANAFTPDANDAVMRAAAS